MIETADRIVIKRPVGEGKFATPEPFTMGEVLPAVLGKHDGHKGNGRVTGYTDTNDGMVGLEANVTCVMPGCRRTAIVRGTTRTASHQV
jgi:hypothetical protein